MEQRCPGCNLLNQATALRCSCGAAFLELSPALFMVALVGAALGFAFFKALQGTVKAFEARARRLRL